MINPRSHISRFPRRRNCAAPWTGAWGEWYDGQDRPDGVGGGPEETRTPDLLDANEALYQLSYGPVDLVGEAGVEPACRCRRRLLKPVRLPIPPLARAILVDGIRLELMTSALSGPRSNQLS